MLNKMLLIADFHFQKSVNYSQNQFQSKDCNFELL